MDHRSLRHFLNLSESLHFGRASEAGHISPSALSRTIRRLEDEVGAVLFDRNNRSVSLTPAGRLFREYARDALNDWESIRGALMEEAGELRGQLSLYCSVTASYSFLYDLLARFRPKHPRIEIKLHTGDPEEALNRVRTGAEDIAIGARPGSMPAGLAFRKISESPLVFIAGRDSEYRAVAKSGRAPAGDWLGTWSGLPMILSERGVARERTDAWFRALGVAPTIYAQVAGNEAIVSMVSLGFGVGVVPRIVLDNSPLKDTIRVLDLHPELPPYEVGLFALEKRLASPLIDAFWQLQQD